MASSLIKFLDLFGKGLLKGMETLANDYGIHMNDVKDSSDPEEAKAGVKILSGTVKEHKFKIKLTPIGEPDSERYDIHLKGDNNKEAKYENIHLSKTDTKKLIRAIQKGCIKLFGEDTLDEVIDDDTGEDLLNSSKRLTCSLTKIVSSKETTVLLKAVNADYCATEALSDLNHVLDNMEFINSIPEGDSSYELTATDTDLEIVPANADETDLAMCDVLRDSFQNIRSRMYLACTGLQYIHWNAKGSEFERLHNITGNAAYKIQSYLDELAELEVEFCGNVIHPYYIISSMTTPEELSQLPLDFNITQGLSFAKSLINDVASELALYYCNFNSDVQSRFDDWIRELDKDANYFIAQTLKQ